MTMQWNDSGCALFDDLPGRTTRPPRLVVVDLSRPGRVSGGDRPQIIWRLLAGNNRAVGQSSTSFASRAEAADAALTVKAAVDELTWHIERISPAPEWRWTASVRTQQAASSTHRYGRRMECTRGFAQFRESLARAELDDLDATGILLPPIGDVPADR